MIRLDISSPETTAWTLKQALSKGSDRAEIVHGDEVIGVLVSMKRLRQLEALEWLASDPRRMARLLDAQEAGERKRIESYSLSDIA
jgi:hypothetical protein